MNQYEVTFIVDPVLSSDEIVGTAQTYVDHLQSEGCKIVHVDEMGLRQLAYPLRKRTTGVYYCIEFSTETGQIIERMELAFRRDERIIRFLTVKLDKYGIKYNEDKRNGLIGKKKSAPATVSEESSDGRKKSGRGSSVVDTKAKSAASTTKSSKPSNEEEE